MLYSPIRYLSLWKPGSPLSAPGMTTAKALPRNRHHFAHRRAHQPAHRACRDDRVLLRIGLVVLLDVIEIVEVVDHQAVGLLQRAARCVAEPVEPLEASAVAEMETRDRIGRHAAAVAGAQIIPGGRAQERLTDRGGNRGIAPPIRLRQHGQRLAIVFVERQRSLVDALAIEPGGEIRRRGKRDEMRDARQFAAHFLDHLLDEEMAERHASKPALAIGDRVEHRGGGALRLDRLALVGQDRRDRARYLAGERHLDENQRLVDQRRMKEGVAAAVRRIDAPAQILPVANFVHRLVADDLFQDHGGRRPIDAAQHEESPIEPRREQVDEIPVDDGEIVAMIHGVKKLLAHTHESCGAAGGQIEPAKQFEPARLAGAMQLGGGFGGWRSPPRGDRRIDAGLIMPEGAPQRLKERDARPGGQIGIIVENFVGERHAQSPRPDKSASQSSTIPSERPRAGVR